MADLTDLQQRRIREVRNYSRFAARWSPNRNPIPEGPASLRFYKWQLGLPIRTTIKLIYNGRLSRYLDDGSLSRYLDRAIRMYAHQLNKSFKVGGLLMSKAFNALRLNRDMPLMSKVFNALRLNRKEALQAEVDTLHEERQFGWSVYFRDRDQLTEQEDMRLQVGKRRRLLGGQYDWPAAGPEPSEGREAFRKQQLRLIGR